MELPSVVVAIKGAIVSAMIGVLCPPAEIDDQVLEANPPSVWEVYIDDYDYMGWGDPVYLGVKEIVLVSYTAHDFSRAQFEIYEATYLWVDETDVWQHISPDDYRRLWKEAMRLKWERRGKVKGATPPLEDLMKLYDIFNAGKNDG